MNKINIAVFFGGIGPEHDISRLSAMNIINNIDIGCFNVLPIYITQENRWLLYEGNLKHLNSERLENLCVDVTIDISRGTLLRISGERVKSIKIDVALPVLHGEGGEDGSIQGLFESAKIKYIGCGISASAIAMDKSATKMIAESKGVSVVPYYTYNKNEIDKELAAKEARSLGYPVFIKPSSAGSSYGCSVAKNKKEVLEAIEEAFNFSDKILIEKFLKVREIEVAILDDGKEIIVSTPGEITTTESFYTFESKYLEDTSKPVIPAELDETILEQIKDFALKIFKSIGGKGLSRVDFFVTNDNKIFFNEVNTMPGFTDISMYPKMLEYAGINTKKIIETLISEALQGNFSKDEE